MSNIGLLTLDGPVLAALRAYEKLGGSSAAARLALIAGDSLEVAKEEWRLAKDTVTFARAIANAADLLAADRVAEAAYRHGEAAVEGLAIAAALGNWGPARLAEAARLLAATVVPPFPVSGHDLAGLGMTPGPDMGRELARLEQAWIESGFALGKVELLALLRT